VLFGVIGVCLGGTWLYAQDEYAEDLSVAFGGIPNVPPATPLFVWTFSAGTALAILGAVIVRFRRQVVDRWILLVPQGEREQPARSIGATTAVGITGLCLAVFGVGDVTAASIYAWVFGWDDDSTSELWRGLPLLVFGLALVLRPQILVGWWSKKSKGAV
jgi:hypothetical protein